MSVETIQTINIYYVEQAAISNMSLFAFEKSKIGFCLFAHLPVWFYLCVIAIDFVRVVLAIKLTKIPNRNVYIISYTVQAI